MRAPKEGSRRPRRSLEPSFEAASVATDLILTATTSLFDALGDSAVKAGGR